MDYTIFLQTLNATYFGNTVQSYLIAAGIMLGAFILGKIISWLVKGYLRRMADKTETKLDDVLINSIDGPLVFFIFIWGVYAGMKYLAIPVGPEATILNIIKILFTISIGWFLVAFVDQLIVQYWIPHSQKTDSDLDDHLVPFIRKFVKVFIIIILIIMIISQTGYNVASLLTGLGIGGLAIALAAQSLLGNIFGGLNIIWDKPFKIGDRIRVDKFDGTVVEIGMRSTKIKTLEGTVVSVPNQMIATQALENLTTGQTYEKKKKEIGEGKDKTTEEVIVEPENPRRVLASIGLNYNTSVEKIREAQAIIKDVVKNTKGTDGNCRTSFKTFGDFSLLIEVVWWVKDIPNLPETVNEVNLGIKEGLDKANIEMAFPTRTVYTKQL